MDNIQALSFTYLEDHPADAARVMERLAPEQSAALLESAPSRLMAPVLRAMLPLHAARCLEPLDDATVAGLLRGMGPQPGVAVLRYLPEPRRARVLAQLPTPMAAALSLVLGYSPDSVGGWMEPEVVAFPADIPSGNVLDRVRRADRSLTPPFYVLDREQRLIGTVELTDLLRADTETPLARLMHHPEHTISAQAQLRSIRDHRGWADHVVLPVVERGERFVGVLRHSVLIRGLTGADSASARLGDTLADLAGSYWFLVASLLTAVISVLPTGARPVSDEEIPSP